MVKKTLEKIGKKTGDSWDRVGLHLLKDPLEVRAFQSLYLGELLAAARTAKDVVENFSIIMGLAG